MVSSRAHYQDNKQYYLDKNRRLRKIAQDFMMEHLSQNPCVDCGESDPIVLEFDHVYGEKKKNVGLMAREGYGLKSIQDEINKCEVVCANCHKRRTYSRLVECHRMVTGVGWQDARLWPE